MPKTSSDDKECAVKDKSPEFEPPSQLPPTESAPAGGGVNVIRDVCCFRAARRFRNEQTVVCNRQILDPAGGRQRADLGIAGCGVVRILARVSAVVSCCTVGIKAVFPLEHVAPQVFDPAVLDICCSHVVSLDVASMIHHYIRTTRFFCRAVTNNALSYFSL